MTQKTELYRICGPPSTRIHLKNNLISFFGTGWASPEPEPFIALEVWMDLLRPICGDPRMMGM